MIDSYIIDKKNKSKRRNDRDIYLFGLCFGIGLILLSICLFLTNSKSIDRVCGVLFLLGLIDLIFNTIYPNSLKYLKLIVSKIANSAGKIILSIILTLIYYIVVCPIGILFRKKQVINNTSTLEDYKYNNNIVNINKHSFIYQIAKVFKFFFSERYAILIPVLILLIVVSLIFLFVQSNLVAPFIYTIF